MVSSEGRPRSDLPPGSPLSVASLILAPGPLLGCQLIPTGSDARVSGRKKHLMQKPRPYCT